MNLAEIKLNDVGDDKFQELLDKLGIIDPDGNIMSVSIVSFLDHSKVAKENMKLKAEYKALKGCVRQLIKTNEENAVFLKTYLEE